MNKFLQVFINTLFAFFFTFEIYSFEIAFLPAILRLDPQRDSVIKNASGYSFAELSAFYADENFHIDVTLPKIDHLSGNVHFSKKFLTSKCIETEADYLFLSEIEISTSTIVNSKVYNCKGRFVSENETVIRDHFFAQFEKHVRKSLNFLPEKKKENFHNSNESEEIIFLVDPSPAFSTEVSNLREVVNELAAQKNISLGLIFPSKKSPWFIRSDQNNQSVVQALSHYQKEKIQLEDIRNSIARSLGWLGRKSASSRKFVIFSGSKPMDQNFDFSNSISSIKKSGYDTFLISGSYYESTVLDIYNKAGRKSANGLRLLTHYQKIGTDEGLKTIFIQNDKVFVSKGFEEGDQNFDELNKIQIPSSQIYSTVKFPHAGNLTEIYESVYQRKIIEKGRLLNNIKSILHEITTKNQTETARNDKKVLLKSKELSVWLSLPNFSENLIGKEITIKTIFVRNSKNSFGFSNIPQASVIQPKIAPIMLTLTPKEIIHQFRNESINFFQCLIKGKILEVK